MTDELDTNRLRALSEYGTTGLLAQAADELDRLRQQLAERGEPTYVPLAIATAPERIRLQISDDEDHYGEPFPGEHSSEVTWCSEPTLACEVPYVRADLAAPPAQSAVPEIVAAAEDMLADYKDACDEWDNENQEYGRELIARMESALSAAPSAGGEDNGK